MENHYVFQTKMIKIYNEPKNNQSNKRNIQVNKIRWWYDYYSYFIRTIKIYINTTNMYYKL
jgi:hypothetical protein